MNQKIIAAIKREGNIDPYKHNGSYELLQTAVKYYAERPIPLLNVDDLNMLHQFGLLRYNKKKRDESIKNCNLHSPEKKNLLDLNQRIAGDSSIYDYNYSIGICEKALREQKNNGNCGLFNHPYYQNGNLKGATKESARIFIGMLTDIFKLSRENPGNEQQYSKMFGIVNNILSNPDNDMPGMRAANASQILHLLKPNVFPILNSWGWDVYLKYLGLEGFEAKLSTSDERVSPHHRTFIFKKYDDISEYANNALKIYEIREKYLKDINFRTIDIVLEIRPLKEDYSGSEYNNSNVGVDRETSVSIELENVLASGEEKIISKSEPLLESEKSETKTVETIELSDEKQNGIDRKTVESVTGAEGNPQVDEPPQTESEKFENDVAEEMKLSESDLIERIKRALANDNLKQPSKRDVTSPQYNRNPTVAALAKLRADGKCQFCEERAPFDDRHGNPYLECHHIQWLSKDGSDTPDNTAALCPNCHRKMHILDRKEDKETLLKKAKQLSGNQ